MLPAIGKGGVTMAVVMFVLKHDAQGRTKSVGAARTATVFAKLVQDARTTRLCAQRVGKVTLEKALAAKDAELRSVRAQNEALTQCVFRQAAKFAAARAAHDAQLEEFHYVLEHFTKLSTVKPVMLRMGSQRSGLRFSADAGAMVVGAAGFG